MGSIVTKEVFGFKDRRVGEVLRDSVLQGDMYVPKSRGTETLAMPGRALSLRRFIGTAVSTITAGTGGDLGTDFTCGTGSAYIGRLNTSTNQIDWYYKSDGVTKMQETVYNLSEQSIAADTGIVFPILQDSFGVFWVEGNLGGILRPDARCTCNAAFDTTDSTVAGTIVTQYGPGVDHPSTSVTLRNFLVTGSTYLFSGASGTAWYCRYDTGTTWNIIQGPCP